MMLQYGAIPVLFASTANLRGQVQALNRCVSISITACVPRQFWRWTCSLSGTAAAGWLGCSVDRKVRNVSGVPFPEDCSTMEESRYSNESSQMSCVQESWDLLRQELCPHPMVGLGGNDCWPPSAVEPQVVHLQNLPSTLVSNCIRNWFTFLWFDSKTFKVQRLCKINIRPQAFPC